MTREEAATQLKITSWAQRDQGNDYLADALNLAIEALEQDTVPFDFELYQAGLMDMPEGMIDVLNEIKAEIMAIGNWTTKGELPNGDLVKVLEIIDKYKAESEDKDD